MKHIVRTSLLLTFLVLGWPAVARAQLFEPLRFTTAFAFQAGQRFLPAGTYVLAPLNGDNGGKRLHAVRHPHAGDVHDGRRSGLESRRQGQD